MPQARKTRITKHYTGKSRVVLFHGDRLDLLSEIHKCNHRAKLVVTSPPYNIGKEYETVTSLEEYLRHQEQTIDHCLDILSETGSICWQVGNYSEGSGRNKETYPLDLVLYPLFKKKGLKLRNRIVWHFGHGHHDRVRFSGRYETILWFTRDNTDYTFNLDAIRVPQKYPGKRAYSGPKKGKPSGNPLGKNPSDIWNIPNVKANHIEKTDHPCQFPIAIIERLVLGLTEPDDLVVDPYLGVGTTAIACLRHGRRVAGSDVELKYLDIARQRLLLEMRGDLPSRPLNRPIFLPTGNAAVDRVPAEWGEINKIGTD